MLELNTVHHGDCVEMLKRINDGSVDLVIIDPPYFNVAKEDWDQFNCPNEYLKWCHEFSDESFRVLKPGGAFYVFGGIGSKNGFLFWNYIQQLAERYTFASYINWKRFRPKGYKGTHNNWGDCREDIAYFIKGSSPKTFNKQYMNEAGLSSASKKRFETTGVGLSCGNIWIDIPEAQLDGGMNRTLVHPSQKPVKLIERMIKASSNQGEIVLDFFAGSGTTGIAAMNLNRNFILIEKDDDYFKLIEKRLKEHKP